MSPDPPGRGPGSFERRCSAIVEISIYTSSRARCANGRSYKGGTVPIWNKTESNTHYYAHSLAQSTQPELRQTDSLSPTRRGAAFLRLLAEET